MPIIEVERELGVWDRYNMSADERRRTIHTSQPEQRFIKDGIVYIAHLENVWCWLSERDGYLHIWNDLP